MDAEVRDMPDLELQLMRRGLDDMAAASERCGRCDRTPLVGEHVHVYDDRVLCELCRELERRPPVSIRPVHGPEFGHTMKLRARPAA
jgi:hypothetical protein